MRYRSCWTAILVVMVLAACGGEPEVVLPPTFTIVPVGSRVGDSNLADATTTLCGSENAADREGRGRWRRWRGADPRIAAAKLVQDARWGWKIIIPPGEYKVPQNLCEDEADRSWVGWALLLFLVGVMVAALLASRASRPAVSKTVHAGV